jgi:pleiotropic regulator 1
VLAVLNRSGIDERGDAVPVAHAPWKIHRVIAGHVGWVKCVAVDPSNEWFATGSADSTIKIWDIATGRLKLTLTGHVGIVHGAC